MMHAFLSLPARCMNCARMLFIEEIYEFCLSAFFSCFLQENSIVNENFLYLFSPALIQRSTFTNFFFLVGKQIFLWFNVCTCRRNNGDVRDQLLNSVCWFFPRAQVRDEESFLPHSRTYTLCVWKRSRELNLYLYVLHTGSLRSHLRKTKWRNWFSALSSKRKIW